MDINSRIEKKFNAYGEMADSIRREVETQLNKEIDDDTLFAGDVLDKIEKATRIIANLEQAKASLVQADKDSEMARFFHRSNDGCHPGIDIYMKR